MLFNRAQVSLLDQWRAERDWHPHFAWWPVEVEPGKTAWLQRVERRLDMEHWDTPPDARTWFARRYIYRLLGRL